MQLLRVKENDQEQLAAATEIAMDLNLGRSDLGDEFYLIIGCRVAILLNERTFAEPEGLISSSPGGVRQSVSNG
jgi:hypothetical protein